MCGTKGIGPRLVPSYWKDVRCYSKDLEAVLEYDRVDWGSTRGCKLVQEGSSGICTEDPLSRQSESHAQPLMLRT